MAITVNLRKVLDRKVWEMMTSAPANTAAGSFTIADPTGEDKAIMLVIGASSIWRYDHFQDAWQQLPNSGIAGTFGAGSCGAFHNLGPSGTATAGTTTTLTTNLTIPRSLKGYKIRITAGPGAGDERTIVSNTYGANSIITVSPAFSATITTSSQYVLVTGRYWFFNAGAGAVGFAYWDRALCTWTQRAVTNLPTTFGTEGRLVSTPGDRADFATGTASSAAATTLVVTGKTWAVNQWTNFQVRITSGTGAGQVRTIASNTADTLTVSAAWTINPTAGSTYAIEGNDDYLYLLGNNAVTMYRYSISGNTWSTLTPGVARGGSLGAGGGANWIAEVPDADWNNESAIKNGRYIYSFRGGAGNNVDYYDIASNAWTGPLVYGNQMESFNIGSCYDVDSQYIYISKESTGRVFRFDLVENRLIPWSTMPYPNGSAVVGDKMWTKSITDGTTTIKWVYMILHTSGVVMRCMMIDD